MEYTQAEILQTVRMTEMEHLDVRTVTLGLSLRDCVRATVAETAEAVREKIERTAARLVPTVDEIGEELGLRVANKRISITPASLVYDRARSGSELLPLAPSTRPRSASAWTSSAATPRSSTRARRRARTPSSIPSPRRWRRPSACALPC